MTIEPFWAQVSEPNLRQGDLLPNCLVLIRGPDSPTEAGSWEAVAMEYDLIVLTQSCDLEQQGASRGHLSSLPALRVRGCQPSLRRKGRWNEVLKGRVEGLHLLASLTAPDDNRQALVVDFREIYSLSYDYLTNHASRLGSRWRLKSPFLEHFSQAFAFFMRVGLPSTIPEFR